MNCSNCKGRGRQACPSLYGLRSRGSSPIRPWTPQATTPPRLARHQDERRSSCAANASGSSAYHFTHISQGGLANDQPERTHKRPQTPQRSTARGASYPSSAGSDQHATPSEVLLTAGTNTSSATASRRLVSSFLSASTSGNSTTSPSTAAASSYTQLVVEIRESQQFTLVLRPKPKPCCAQRLHAHNAPGRSAALPPSPCRQSQPILPRTDLTKFTTPPAHKNRRDGETYLLPGDVKGCAGVPDPILGLCIRLLNRRKHNLRTTTTPHPFQKTPWPSDQKFTPKITNIPPTNALAYTSSCIHSDNSRTFQRSHVPRSATRQTTFSCFFSKEYQLFHTVQI